ncbi:SMP-30/gluconolactonase/LRE family protein [Rathayibacter tanaceti]|uniref:Lactonase drp35 n=2 Tax=Rathayibacter tanaceti TaxID=1671680 RepID=A0A166HGU5_9MICO|nr:SMP-30/gluconolactonase/LRE family protein [Rathayibacter tanaceti]KZX20571.1 Lactonase drp35 [Rathayibacter tanaceti]QHC54541.1 SMP-30/gluconolactonase/LRE family protein [Rathayibacter tanaceti]TCO33905.1 lactonase [Rathayibacter tanaceti]
MRWRAVAVPVLLAGALAGCTEARDPDGSPPSVVTAERVLRVTDVHEATGMTLLEGPTFGADGRLTVVDVTAPPGAAKVLRIDLDEGSVEPVWSDDRSALTSAQFGPEDGRLYVTDFLGGSILSMTPDGEDVREVAGGPVDGVPMQPDDLTFGADGALYVSDAAGAQDPYWEASGRVIRVDPETGESTVLARDLPSPNGIAFSPDHGELWVSMNTGNRIDRLTLAEGGAEVATAFPAIHASPGIGQLDSIAVDAAGNLYVGLHGRPEILVYDASGALVQTVTVAEPGVTSATNVAIRPGTTEAFATVSGPDGGFVHTFEALAEGVPQSNGG